LTAKHKKNENGNILESNGNENQQFSSNSKYTCQKCDKEFNNRSGLWKHNKKCANEEKMFGSDFNEKEIIMTLLQQNNQLQNQIIELCKDKSVNINNTNAHINSHNKTFNLNVFLNETCKDAMNIMDFVDSVKLQLSDLESIGRLGFVEGISSIIIKNLQALDVHKRPVHCSDSKREVMYIKDEDKWEKENEEKKKLRKAIKKIANKNYVLIPEFKEKHPDCIKSSSPYSDQYNKLIIEAMGGSGDNDLEKENKIIRNIAKNVIIDKSLEKLEIN
jgi:CRISPR type III-B/RAMP module RAMP protein Cmr1